ncbi:MAG: transcription antitermination factor NusB [Phycisphaerales bacterium]
MATPRDIRRLAFQLLFQLDAHGGADEASLRAWATTADTSEGFAPRDIESALGTAQAAFAARAAADAEFDRLAPAWPARRQAAVDRAILRLCHFELTRPDPAPLKAIVNDAVELAKEFSTDRSPAFINGLLDKVLKRISGAESAMATDPRTETTGEPPAG